MLDHHAGPSAGDETVVLPAGLNDLDDETVAIARALFAPALYADLALPSETDPDRLWEHCVRHWEPRDRFPSLFFDAEYYREKISQGEAPPLQLGESIFLHWLSQGLPRRIVPTPRFDEAFYHHEHADIAAWGAFGFTHFIQHGLREGRRATPWFDPNWYARELGSTARTETAYVHFLSSGIAAGFTANEWLAHFLQWRDCGLTPQQYDDLLAASARWSRALSAESFSLLLALYVPESHRNHSGVDDVTELIEFLRRGIASGASPGPLFDANEYAGRARAAGRPLPAASEVPLLHWLANGAEARVVPTARFDEAFYRKSYPDIERTTLWGFFHFVRHGAFEGRSPNASFPIKRGHSGRLTGLPLCYRSWIREDRGASAPQHARGGEPASPEAFIDEWNQRVHLLGPTSIPTLSVVVIAEQNDPKATIRCITSMARPDFPTSDTEFIVVGNGSPEGLAESVASLAGVTYVRGDVERGFAHACNRGAAVARGKYLCFVRGDAELLPGCLDGFVTTLEEDDAVGIAGAKLMRRDGRLGAAGGILWRDGTRSNYGRDAPQEDPQYNFLRDADDVGNAALVVRAELFARLGGFSAQFGDSEYDGSDLCLGVRSLGYRIVYQPLCGVIVADRVAELDEKTRAAFCKKWGSQLRGHLESGASVHAAARRINRQHVVLMLEPEAAPPAGEHDAPRLPYIARIFRQIGYSVTLLPFGYAEPAYARELQQLGVEVLYRIDGARGRSWAEVFDDVTIVADLVWTSVPLVFEAYESLLHRDPQTKVIYDALGARESAWLDRQRMDVDCAARADATVVATDAEKRALEDAGASEVFVVPNVHRADEAESAWTVELQLRELIGGIRRRAERA